MPKLLVLFQSLDPADVGLAEAARDGARSVRFAEVDLRRFPGTNDAAPPGGAHRTLEHVDDVGAYDGVILVTPGRDAEGGLARTIAAAGVSLADKVGSVLTAASGAERRGVLWGALTPLADGGMILVPAAFGDDGASTAESARRLGKRVAEVIGWVTHARSHHHHEPSPHEPHHHHEHHSPHQH